MNHRETCSVTATLVPQAGTATLLRIVSVLHGRGVEVHDLTFAAGSDSEGTVTARVTLGNVGRTTLEGSLRHVLELVEVSTRGERPLDLVTAGG